MASDIDSAVERIMDAVDVYTDIYSGSMERAALYTLVRAELEERVPPKEDTNEHKAFEEWATNVMECTPDDLTYETERRCHTFFVIHFAWKAWQARANR